MFEADRERFSEVRDRSGYAKDPVIRPRAEVEIGHRAFDEARAIGAQA